jgi:hypothetical protein
MLFVISFSMLFLLDIFLILQPLSFCFAVLLLLIRRFPVPLPGLVPDRGSRLQTAQAEIQSAAWRILASVWSALAAPTSSTVSSHSFLFGQQLSWSVGDLVDGRLDS